MAFQALSAELVWAICSCLPVRDVGHLALTRRSVHRLLTSAAADIAVWSEHASRQLRRVFEGAVPKPSFDLAKWNVTTHRRLCEVLARWGHLVGRWRWEVPVRGGVLVVGVDPEEEPYSTIVADLVVPNQCSTLLVQSVTEFHNLPVFEVHFSDEQCVFSVEGVTVVDPSALRITGSLALDMADALPPLPSGASRDCPFGVMRDYLRHMAHRDLKFRRLVAAPAGRPEPPLPGAFDPLSLLGLYEGVLGPHGLEILHVELDTDGRLQGLKVTGDPNVPAGQVCFRAVGDWEPADPACDCEHGCGCWRPERDPGRGWELAGMFRLVARTASHGFHNPQWNPGRLLVCTQKDVASPSSSSSSLGPASMRRFLIVVWDNFFSTRLAPLQW